MHYYSHNTDSATLPTDTTGGTQENTDYGTRTILVRVYPDAYGATSGGEERSPEDVDEGDEKERREEVLVVCVEEIPLAAVERLAGCKDDTWRNLMWPRAPPALCSFGLG